MGRKTLTIHDEDKGAALTVQIENDGNGGPRVTEIKFVADPGGGLSQTALALMGDLGLSLPDTPAVASKNGRRMSMPERKKAARAPKRVPRQASAATAAPAQREPAAAAAGELGQGSRPALPAALQAGSPAFVAPTGPDDDPPASPPAPAPAPAQRRSGPPPGEAELRASFQRHNGSMQAMAAQFGCSVQTVSNWLRKAREGGAKITLAARA